MKNGSDMSANNTTPGSDDGAGEDSIEQGRSIRLGDSVAETTVLLDAVIHDLRTPLSAMSGWLEVLESHLGEADGIVGRALLGLRRGVNQQTKGLNDLSDVLLQQRVERVDLGETRFLGRLQQGLQQLDSYKDPGLDEAESDRLEPLRSLDISESLVCADAGSSLVDACATLLRAVATAQADSDGPISVTSDRGRVLIAVPGASGDRSALTGLVNGLGNYVDRRAEIDVQSVWLARATLQRCGLTLKMRPAGDGGIDLLIKRPSF